MPNSTFLHLVLHSYLCASMNVLVSTPGVHLPYPPYISLQQFNIPVRDKHAAHHTAHKPRPGSIRGPSRLADITNLQFTGKSD